MAIKIKPAYAHIRIGFNNSSARLGERDDLHKLYDVAKAKNHKQHLDMFEVIPDQAELDAIKEKNFNLQQQKKRQRRTGKIK